MYVHTHAAHTKGPTSSHTCAFTAGCCLACREVIGKCCSVWVWGCLVLGAIVSWPLPWRVILRDLPWVEIELGQLPACYSFQAVQRFEGSPTIHCLAPRLALALCASGPPQNLQGDNSHRYENGDKQVGHQEWPFGPNTEWNPGCQTPGHPHWLGHTSEVSSGPITQQILCQ